MKVSKNITKLQYPDWNIMDYDGSLRKNLSFYNLEVDNSILKTCALSFWKTQGKDTSRISKLTDGWFSTVGAVVHMMTSRAIELEVKDMSYTEKRFNQLNKINELKDESTPKLEIDKEAQIAFETSRHIAEFENGLDLINSGNTFDGKSYLLRLKVKAAITKKIADWFKVRHLKEFKEIQDDKQLTESYSHMSKKEMRVYKEAIEGFIMACTVASTITKAAKKSKVKKVKAPSVLVQKVNYMIEYTSLNMKSVHPVKLINSSEIWLFNTKNRKLFKYVPVPGGNISVRGTTITGFDPENSGGKIIRKPEDILKGCESFTSRPMNKVFNDARATLTKPMGRINEDTIILKCFEKGK